MNGFKKYGKIILFDTLAIFCFIGVVLFGWLPGPGGIPLFLLGLGLLAVNHDWAERWLETAKHKGVTFKKWLFPNKTWVKNTYDVFVSIGILLGLYLTFGIDDIYFQAMGVAVTMASLFIFLLNRDRFDSFASLIKRK